MDMFKCTLHQVLRTVITHFILTHPPTNVPCGRKPECPEKTHDFRQSVGILFSHEKFEESLMENRTHNSEVKGARANHCATEASSQPDNFVMLQYANISVFIDGKNNQFLKKWIIIMIFEICIACPNRRACFTTEDSSVHFSAVVVNNDIFSIS